MNTENSKPYYFPIFSLYFFFFPLAVPLYSSMAPTKQAKNSVPPPPRTLNVQKFAESRAPELETLHSIISNRMNNDFRSQRNKRRRTTGHDNRKKKGKFGSKKLGVNNDNKKEKKVSRRVRRRMEFKKNDEVGFGSSGDGTKRLRTHVWHAKRFTMTKLWGFHLPLGLQGRGRGSRALLKWYRNGALVHDASYYGTVQLDGAEDLLLSLLDMVLVPSPSSCVGKVGRFILSGVSYGKAMLHHIGRPTSRPIAPVTYMWRPYEKQGTDILADSLNSDGSCQSHSIGCGSPFRQLWVWIHPSAFSEGFDALKLACSEKTKETGGAISCLSLEGQLAKLEVMGSKAFQLLQKILQLVVPSENSWEMQRCSNLEVHDTYPKKSIFLDNENQMPSSAIAALVVNDPRTLPVRKKLFASDAVSQNVLNDLSETAAQTQSTLKEGEDKYNNTVPALPALSMEPAENTVFIGSKSLWDANKRMSPPVQENVLLKEKHHLRLASFCLAATDVDIHKSSDEENCSRSCPIMLIKDSNENHSLNRWSILLPLSWSKAFWVPLVSNGAHAIGQREKHWIACEVGLPYFPSDFPDCGAYSSFKATEAAVFYQKAECRPPAVRPLRVPIPPPWDCVQFALAEDGCMEVEEIHACNEDAVKGASTGADCTPYSKEVSPDCSVSKFKGLVARTSKLVSDFLNEIHGDHLPFFPYRKDRNFSLSILQDEDKSISSQTEPTQMMKEQNLCFVRVLLHAYREGVFEEEAVVCAPRVTDVLLWTSRAEDDEGRLQISQSTVSTYFTEHPSGNWELQIPESPASKESYRWPIGFVTTGFVRGSKKAVACALCEATMLSRLREEQWKEIPEKSKRKEIYVLVRNLRSTAYRLALATVVLEQQEDDIDFM